MIFEIHTNFSPYAKSLRAHFERRFQDPHHSTPDRFVWDFWNIPNEYTFLRTPAFHYFPQALYRKFHTHLVNWGRENLGCHDISPTWLSYYINGCQQHLHRDEPHGPLAFVLSLTPWEKRKFSGGETLITKTKSSFYKVPAKFNQLLVFNPAIPHGVSQVKGIMDPLQARLVLHGWFVQPRVFWKGPMRVKDVAPVLNEAIDGFAKKYKRSEGFVSFRMRIAKTGEVKKIWNLIETVGDEKVLEELSRELQSLQFPRRPAPTELTLPLVFR
jgi:hypothetical protein